MKTSIPTIRKCTVIFNEEKFLVEQIIEKVKDSFPEDEREFYNLLKNISSIEKNIATFNLATERLWVGTSIGRLRALWPIKNFEDESLSESMAPEKFDKVNLKIITILTYFENHSIDDACDELDVALENVYSSAWRIKTALPEFRNFKPKGVTFVRNHLLEHPSEDFKWVLSQNILSISHAPKFNYVKEYKVNKKQDEEKLEIDIEKDLIEFKDELNRRLITKLKSLTN